MPPARLLEARPALIRLRQAPLLTPATGTSLPFPCLSNTLLMLRCFLIFLDFYSFFIFPRCFLSGF
jgi:hypothetical protein